jgi:hypothetical protein
VLLPLSATEAIYYPAAFDDYAQRSLKQHVPTLIEVRSEEAARFACNAVVVGRNVVLNTGCPNSRPSLRSAGFTPYSTELGEFIKAGGSAKCLTLRLDGEDAAQWPLGLAPMPQTHSASDLARRQKRSFAAAKTLTPHWASRMIVERGLDT